MLAFVIVFLKGLLVPLRSKAPTLEESQAFDDWEDETGNYTGYSPAERHQDALDWREEMCSHTLWTLARWRLSVAWMPFCRGEQRLVGERLSRWLMPDLWGIRHRRLVAEREAIRAERATQAAAEEAARVAAERAEMIAELVAIKVEKEGF